MSPRRTGHSRSRPAARPCSAAGAPRLVDPAHRFVLSAPAVAKAVRITGWPKFGVGIMDPVVVARPTASVFTRANYLSAVGSRVDSFWVPDHLNALFPRSIWKQKYCGGTRIVPTVDAVLEPWTMLGHLAARNRVGRLRLGTCVTDTGRRNPPVTARSDAPSADSRTGDTRHRRW